MNLHIFLPENETKSLLATGLMTFSGKKNLILTKFEQINSFMTEAAII